MIPGGRLGPSWKPPLAVATWLLDKAGQGRAVPSCASVYGSAGGPASPQYRGAFLAALGLHEGDLRGLVVDYLAAKGGETFDAN